MPVDHVSAAPDAVLRSRDLAELAGTTPRALRHYHAVGLLPEAPRDANGYRRYSIEDLLRLLRIRQLAASGVPLRKMSEVLDHGPDSIDALFEEIDGALAAEIEQLQEQRRMLAAMRRTTAQVHRLSGRTATAKLDQDMWTLLTATEQISATTAGAVLDALDSGPLAEKAAEWFAQFQALESEDTIDDEAAGALASRIAEFAQEMMAATGITSGASDVGDLAEQLQRSNLSPAQHAVWERVASFIR